MIIKIIGSVLTILSFTALGFYFSNELKLRLSQMRELKKNIMILRGDIRYGGTPLPEALASLAHRSAGAFHDFFENTAEKLSDGEGGTFSEIWGSCVDKELKNTSLKEQDKDQLIRLGENLGFLDQEMQLNTIDLYLNLLEEEIKEQAENVKERTRIYNMLGFMAGLFITIIIL